MKILYVEDNPTDVDLTIRKFQKSAYVIETTIARSQVEALKIIKGDGFSDYDLVLTDMHLQDGDGIAILSHIRGHSLPVAVVLLTGQGDEAAAVSALKAGADDYVIKKQGYLDKLPKILEEALASYCETKDIGVQLLKILYLEHNQVDVDLTRRHLEQHAPHIQMDAIFSVHDFYQQIKQSDVLAPYSALLLDYRLPQENALEIVKMIKESSNPDIPVILVTGKGDEEIAVKALKLGVFDYVTKDQGYLYKLPSIVENAYYSIRLSHEHEALLESEKRYRSLFENNHVAMLLVDPENGDIIDANLAATAFYGWTHQELIEKSMHEINTLAVEALEKKIADAVKEEQNHFILKHQVADGSIRDVEIYSGPIDIGGRSLLYSMVYDITQRLEAEREKKKLQKMLIQAQKMESIGMLAGGIAHDFNNILTAIIGYTQLALDDVEKNSPIEDDLKEVYTASQRAKELVAQVLAFARQSEEEIKPLRVDSILREVLQLIRATIPTSIEIKTDIHSKSLITGNHTQLHQIVMNLCTNAAHAMEEKGGILQINLKDIVVDGNFSNKQLDLTYGDYIRISISDTGTGIPSDILESIFEPYFTTKETGEGTGMGLAVVYGIVESYGGKITVKSEFGKGATFEIYIPATGKYEFQQKHESKPLPKGIERVLIVDDEAPIAKMLAQNLKRLGYIVTSKTNSLEALELFQAKPNDFDLIVTDMTMPNLTGDALAIKSMRIRQDIPIILCTGYSKKISNETASQIGIKAFVYKPILQSDFVKTVRKVLDEAKDETQK